MNGYVWFRITLLDTSGQVIAQWPYDSAFPIMAPRFTYPNLNAQCPYMIEFVNNDIREYLPLPAGVTLNDAIDRTVREFAVKVGGR